MSTPITRRQFGKMGALMGGAVLLDRFSGAEPRRPNVIVIIADDLGFGDLSCHGNRHLQTPNLDRLAAEGVEFTRFYGQPLCSPSRSGLMTGRYNYRTAVQHTSRGGALMAGDEVTMADMFHAAGYVTGMFGKWHLGDNYPLRPVDRGFDESLMLKGGSIGSVPDLPNSYFGPLLYHNGKAVKTDGYCTDVFTDATIRFIEANRSRPFLAYFAANVPHAPLVVDARYSDPFRAAGCDDDLATLYGMEVNLDENVGRILKRLRELKLEENTIVMFMSDHGAWGAVRRYNAGLSGWKGSVADGGTRVPFFFRWPARFAGGIKIDRVAAHIDVLPTLLEAAGVKKTERVRFDGVSLMPLLRGPEGHWPDRDIFLQVHRGLIPQRYQNCAVRGQRWKISSHADDEAQHEPKDLPLKPDFKLYDMERDPGETTDLAQQHPEIANRMKAAYDEWYEKMRHARDWAVGVIHIGSEKEPVSHLCVYQDSCFDLDTPTGWSVAIERGGRYRVTVNRPAYPSGKLMVKFNENVRSERLAFGENSKVVTLPAGSGMLTIWVEQKGAAAKRLGSAQNWEYAATSTMGDCDVEFLGT